MQGCHDLPGDLVLHREDLLQLAAIGLGPENEVLPGVYELGGHPERAPEDLHRPLQDRIHPKVPGYLGAGGRDRPVPQYVYAGRNPERSDLAQPGDELVGETGTEVEAVLFTLSLLKVEDRQGALILAGIDARIGEQWPGEPKEPRSQCSDRGERTKRPPASICLYLFSAES